MSRIITIDGKRWAAGLSWRSYDKPPTRALIKTEAKSLGANAYVQRSGNVRTLTGIEPRYDVGYAAIGKDRNNGSLNSLASALSGTRPGPWVGVFTLNEALSYYIAVDANGAIIPDQYGEVIGSPDLIAHAKSAHADLVDAALVEGDLKTLETLLRSAPGPFERIRFISRATRLGIFQIVPVVVLGAVSFGGYELYQYHEIQVKKQQEAARLAAILAQSRKPKPISPLNKAMRPAEWLVLCNPGRWNLPFVENGWRLSQFECLSNEVVLTWHRGEGANTVVRPPGTLTADGNVITQFIGLGTHFIPKPGPSPYVPSFSQGRADLQAWAQIAKFSVQFGPVSNVVGFNLKQAQVTIDSPLVPWDLTSLNKIQGLRLNALNSTSSGEWIIKGVLFGT